MTEFVPHPTEDEPAAFREEMMSEDVATPLPLAGLAAASAGALALAACGGGSSSSSPSPPPTTVVPPQRVSATQASRFLSQAAIGHSKADVLNLSDSGFEAWLTSQFVVNRTQRFWDFLTTNGYDVATNMNSTAGFDPMVWSQLMGSGDVLRQRVGLALLDQWAVGVDGFGGAWRQFALAAYLDILWDNALGNYRDLMEGVSTSVAMGLFLTFLGNTKANPATGSIPDENYARELMQLFTIGLYMLNPDGTTVMAGGNPIPSYSQADVAQAARVWTGYTFASTDNSNPARMRLPMTNVPARFESGGSSFLGINIPAGSDAAAARKLALDGLFNHQNVPPFVSKQLIQHLVTSNPSPAYVGRVATVFANNGSGVRGDMKAVVRAVLMDSEARDDGQVNSATFGKLREPVVRLVQWAKAFAVTSPTQLWPFGNTSSSANRLAESPGRAPSVFNWFRPGYTPAGTVIATSGMVAPEFQITNEPSVIAYVNYMQSVIANGAGEARPNYSTLSALAADSQQLLNELNLVLAANQISASTIAQMKTALDSIAATTTDGASSRIYAAILLVMASPEYLVLR